MDQKFQLFYEKRAKNPLRKKNLEARNILPYSDWINYAKNKLSGATYKKIRNLKDAGEHEFAASYKQQKIEEENRT